MVICREKNILRPATADKPMRSAVLRKGKRKDIKSIPRKAKSLFLGSLCLR